MIKDRSDVRSRSNNSERLRGQETTEDHRGTRSLETPSPSHVQNLAVHPNWFDCWPTSWDVYHRYFSRCCWQPHVSSQKNQWSQMQHEIRFCLENIFKNVCKSFPRAGSKYCKKWKMRPSEMASHYPWTLIGSRISRELSEKLPWPWLWLWRANMSEIVLQST